jgi:NAD(P)H-quinone oxidoreductase subunit 5
LVAAFASVVVWNSGRCDWVLVELPLGMGPGVYFDELTAIMLLLISFVGMVIVIYSVRYLEGEVRQGRFLKWMAFTLGAVMLLVISRNLAMLVAAWVLSSYGLHQLLMHYEDRPWAVWAARKKFLISRLGDTFLLAALIATSQVFGALDYGSLFAAAELMRQGGIVAPGVGLIGVLFAMGALTKSAQFPFHSWLPDTMETPTPVSALMHAGVINAGGFLMIRLSPLVSLSWLAMDLLLVVGAATALLGGVVMLTQTSIKRMLAWSTIAQMGFMILQCGLGAFSAALLHLVAHSLYKAHAFLSSGSVVDQSQSLRGGQAAGAQVGTAGPRLWLGGMVVGIALSVAVFAGVVGGLRVDLSAKSGVWLLGLVQVLALAQILGLAMVGRRGGVVLASLALAAVVCCGYWSFYLLIDWCLRGIVPGLAVVPSVVGSVLVLGVGLGFLLVFALPWIASRGLGGAALRSLYVHAVHGFYLDVPVRVVTARVWGQASPSP